MILKGILSPFKTIQQYREKNSDNCGNIKSRKAANTINFWTVFLLIIFNALVGAFFVLVIEGARYITGEKDVPEKEFHAEYSQGSPKLQLFADEAEKKFSKIDSSEKESKIINEKLQEIRDKSTLYIDEDENLYKKIRELPYIFDNWGEGKIVTLRKEGNVQEIIDDTSKLLQNNIVGQK